jgi:Zn-dependent protease
MDRIVEAMIGFVVFVFSVVVHETAHGLAAEHFGDPTARYSGRITLNPIPHIDPIGSVLIPVMAYISHIPFVGWAKPVPVNPANLRNPFVHNAYVAAAGPASNFMLVLLGTVGWIVVRLLFKHIPFLMANGEGILSGCDILFGSMIIINSVLGVFNLLPVPPLDGHWILFRFLPPRMGEMLAFIRPYGFFILIILLWTGVLGGIVSLPIRLIYYNMVDLVNAVVNAL